MSKKRISNFSNFINTIRNASEKGTVVQTKTEKVIAYMQRSETIDEMYSKIHEDTKSMQKEQREQVDRQTRDARNDFADLGIGEVY